MDQTPRSSTTIEMEAAPMDTEEKVGDAIYGMVYEPDRCFSAALASIADMSLVEVITRHSSSSDTFTVILRACTRIEMLYVYLLTSMYLRERKVCMLVRPSMATDLRAVPPSLYEIYSTSGLFVGSRQSFPPHTRTLQSRK